MANESARKLRKATTPQEVKLWARLRRLRAQGLHFWRQAPFDGYIVDFVSFRHKVVIEIDGGQHADDSHAARDAARDAHLVASGFSVLRFWNSDVDRNLDGVLSRILDTLDRP